MQKIISLTCVFLLIAFFTNAQTDKPCGFEELFTIKPGMSKTEALQKLDKDYRVTPTHTQQQRVQLPYYKDSITIDITTYHIDSSACFQGHKRTFVLEFANNKLYKAYLATEFSSREQPILADNFNRLRTHIKSKWKYEEPIKFGDTFLKGKGYVYTKTRKKESQPETVTLQYVQQKGNESIDPLGVYILEIIWANLKNTRMQNMVY